MPQHSLASPHLAPVHLIPPHSHNQVFDVRFAIRPLVTLPFPAGASSLAFHPAFTSTLVIGSMAGLFAFADIGVGAVVQTYQVGRWGGGRGGLACQVWVGRWGGEGGGLAYQVWGGETGERVLHPTGYFQVCHGACPPPVIIHHIAHHASLPPSLPPSPYRSRRAAMPSPASPSAAAGRPS